MLGRAAAPIGNPSRPTLSGFQLQLFMERGWWGGLELR